MPEGTKQILVKIPCNSLAEHRVRQVVELLLIDPETKVDLEVSSPLDVERSTGKYSFEVANPRTGKRWRHTILTEEL